MTDMAVASGDMSTVPSEPSAATRSGPGGRLAAARTAKGFSVGDISTRLKFSPRQIEALEANDYLALPGSTFTRGMVRSYARFLGLDVEAILKEVNATLEPPAAVKVHDLRVPFQGGQPRSNKAWLALSALVLVGAGLVAADWLLRERELARVAEAEREAQLAAQSAQAQQEPVQNVPAPELKPGEGVPVAGAADPLANLAPIATAPEAPARIAPVAPGMRRVKLTFAKESWVTVKDAGGTTIMNQLNAAGTEQTVEGKAPLSLVVGNSSGVSASVNGQPLKLAPVVKNDIARVRVD
jgi:cytoskeleton protein RodZ